MVGEIKIQNKILESINFKGCWHWWLNIGIYIQMLVKDHYNIQGREIVMLLPNNNKKAHIVTYKGKPNITLKQNCFWCQHQKGKWSVSFIWYLASCGGISVTGVTDVTGIYQLEISVVLNLFSSFTLFPCCRWKIASQQHFAILHYRTFIFDKALLYLNLYLSK